MLGPCQQAVVRALPFDAVWSFDNQPESDAPTGGGDKRVPNARNAIDGVAHDRQPFLRRVHDFQDRLLRLSESGFGWFRARPHEFNDLVMPVVVLAAGCGNECERSGLGPHSTSRVPQGEKALGCFPKSGRRQPLKNGLARLSSVQIVCLHQAVSNSQHQ